MSDKKKGKPEVVAKQLKSSIMSVKTPPKGRMIATEAKKNKKVSESRI